MQASDLPTRIIEPFGASAGGAYIRAVPNTPSGVPGEASFDEGFPPICFTPVAGGGIPPFGQDFNGLFNQITAWNRWQAAGGPVTYNATFQTAIGGYPAGATVASATTLGLFWLSLVDNNTTNPDTGGANWRGFTPGPSGSYGVAGGTANAMTLTVTPAVPAYSTGLTLQVRAALANTAAGVTINLNSLGAKSIKLGDNSDPAVGQITAGAVLDLVYDGTNFIWSNGPPLLRGWGSATAGGTANALTATVTPLQAYNYGLLMRVEAAAANTGAMTLNVNSLGAVAIVHGDGSAITSGEVGAGDVLLLYYDGTSFVWANAPWGTTATTGTNSKRFATTAFVQAAILAGTANQYYAASTATPFAPMTFNAIDCSAGAVTIPLPPSPTVGTFLTFVDIAKVWGTSNFTLGRNGNTIMSLAEDLACNVSNLQFSIWWNGTTWVLF